ncbi:MAG: spore cortex biosynthesis protein YabQ [Oscillospiraceae bacterium]|nr:spore cortex biosynthesis protein YabQ [Oscillospiraceae bacterium]
MNNQAYIFVIFILYGFLTGLLFDVFRVLRKSFKTPDFLTHIHDIVFWVIVGITLLFTIFRFNNGELRGYIFIGVVLGALFYLLLFSKAFLKVSTSIIEIIKTTVGTFIIRPIKIVLSLLLKIIFRPFSFVFAKFRKIFTKFILITNKTHEGLKALKINRLKGLSTKEKHRKKGES